MDNAFEVVKMFERSLAEYCGAPYAVALNSCSAAIKMALRVGTEDHIILPSKTYRSVYIAARQLGYSVEFSDHDWEGMYRLSPTNVLDAALVLYPNMYIEGTMMCLSFHPQKPLALSSGGGAILHDSPKLDVWFRRQRWDGRQEGVAIQEDELIDGDHCYMFPAQAAEALHKLNIYNTRPPAKIPHPDYEDLSKKVSKWN